MQVVNQERTININKKSEKLVCKSRNDDSDEEQEACVLRESFERPPLVIAALTYLGFYVLLFLGYVNLLFRKSDTAEKGREGYPPLHNQYDKLYKNYIYRRVRDCLYRPISTVPGVEVTVMDRVTHDNGWTFKLTGTYRRCLNLASYNYLGFAQSEGPCAEDSIKSINKYGLSLCSTIKEYGSHKLIKELEETTAKFLGVEDAMVFGMGFATNALNLPSLVSSDCLVISDEKNHASLLLGLRLSGARIHVFKHNNMKDLEKIIRNAIVYGHPRTKCPWKKILVVVEGVYSMEGSIVNLPKILKLKKKYKFYLYLDEAHSIGALGPRGRGVVDYFNCNPKDVDILMGTFTKSFGSAGGYLAGTKVIVDYFRQNSHAVYYATSMSPPLAQQIITSMKIIMGEDGTSVGQNRIKQLAINSRYFRRRLKQMGLIVYGNEDSPVVPVLTYSYSKSRAVVRGFYEKNIGVVGIGFPGTSLMEARIRFCLSAAHTKEQLDKALDIMEELATNLGLKYSRLPREHGKIPYYETG